MRQNVEPREAAVLDGTFPQTHAVAKIRTKVVQRTLELKWSTPFEIPEVLSNPPRMNEAYLWLNALVGCNVHGIELIEIVESRVRIVLQVSIKGLFPHKIPIALAHGTPVRYNDEMFIRLEKLHTVNNVPAATITFVAKKK